MKKDNCSLMDNKMIIVHFRDINGYRFSKIFKNVATFQEFNWEEYDDENYEILLVEWGQHCIYNALSNERVYIEELIGFFA